MTQYITSAEVISFIWAECDSTTADLLVAMSEAIFNQLVDCESLVESAKTEYHEIRDFKRGKVGRVFYLKTYKPTTITSINDVPAGNINVDYTLVWRRLEFQYAKDLPTSFPYRFKVIYTSGLATIPSEIKTCCYYLAKGLFDKKKYTDMTSFRQDLLSVNFGSSEKMIDLISDPSKVSFISLITSKYLVPYYYAI